MQEFFNLFEGKETPAIFVVHGIGNQERSETSVQLFREFEKTIDELSEEWSEVAIKKVGGPPRGLGDDKLRSRVMDGKALPLPHDGYWGNYDNVQQVLEEEQQRAEEAAADRNYENGEDRPKPLSEYEEEFLRRAWPQGVTPTWRTFMWYVRQLVCLNFAVKGVKLGTRLIYLLMVPAGIGILTLALFKKRSLFKDYLNDVRIYVDPNGKLEELVRDRITQRVKAEFLRLVGLTEDFEEITDKSKLLEIRGQRRSFKRVVWVAHSLGTVISFNVLADLFWKANELDKAADNGCEGSREKADRFRNRLARFVTFGSPLDKIATLFPRALKKWPSPVLQDYPPGTTEKEKVTRFEPRTQKDPRIRRQMLHHGDLFDKSLAWGTIWSWWLNLYHVLDPVSGPLDHKTIRFAHAPVNFHVRRGWVPGACHSAYWRDPRLLKYMITRAYGSSQPDFYSEMKPLDQSVLYFLTMLANVIWVALLLLASWYVYDVAKIAANSIWIKIGPILGAIGDVCMWCYNSIVGLFV